MHLSTIPFRSCEASAASYSQTMYQNRESKKYLLIFAQVFPPTIGGTPTVLRNLLPALPKGSFKVISQAESSKEKPWISSFDQVRLCPPGKLMRRIDPTGFLRIPWIMFHAARLLSREETHAVLAIFPNTAFLIAGWLLARVWGVDFYVYFMDTFAETQSRWLTRWVANRLEEPIVRSAQRIFCISQALTEFFSSKFTGADCVCLPQSVPTSLTGTNSPTEEKLQAAAEWKRKDEFLIVYTGQIYESTVDSIHNLIVALDYIQELNPKVIFCTPDPSERLQRWGIQESSRVKIMVLPSSQEVQRMQRAADILFNPVSFKYANTVQVRTLFPTKTLEYLQADRPILVHGPTASSFVRYAKQKGFAKVVDQPDSIVLAGALREIAAMPDAAETLAARRAILKAHDCRLIADNLTRGVGMTDHYTHI